VIIKNLKTLMKKEIVVKCYDKFNQL
jgi:hypothetical protein